MLVAYDVALDLVRALRPVVAQLRIYSAEAADQIERAASSVVLNIAEGARRNGRDPRRFFDMAHGSANEIRGALDLADAWGWHVESSQARLLLDREMSLLWGLTRRSRAKDASLPAPEPGRGFGDSARTGASRRTPVAGSRNSDLTDSGNSGV